MPYQLIRFIPAWAGNTRKYMRRCLPPSVHPRVGGEHPRFLSGAWRLSGSSPRGRGTHVASDHTGLDFRFIPAWAGNTSPISGDCYRPPVHPRVGGEHFPGECYPVAHDGSSPRGRGTLAIKYSGKSAYRFIPAWAGNTPASRLIISSSTVHPRVGGEHQRLSPQDIVDNGSSPRGRGTP